LIFQAVYAVNFSGIMLAAAAVVSIYYVISGLRRLIQFNINADAGEVAKFFTGVPTPLGAILLWLVYLASTYGFLPDFGVLLLMVIIGWSLNSKIKVPHP
jgi:CDP-diacylglycerol--serine O-phosphatidyltransferase